MNILIENIFNIYRSIFCMVISGVSIYHSIYNREDIIYRPLNNNNHQAVLLSNTMIYYLSLDLLVMLLTISSKLKLFRFDLVIHHTVTLVGILTYKYYNYDNIIVLPLCAEAISSFNWVSILYKNTKYDIYAQKYKLFIIFLRQFLWVFCLYIAYNADFFKLCSMVVLPLIPLDIFWISKLIKKLFIFNPNIL